MRSRGTGWRSGTQRVIFEKARKAGWDWYVNGESHVTIVSPDGIRITLSRTANDKGRQGANLRAAARRAGLEV